MQRSDGKTDEGKKRKRDEQVDDDRHGAERRRSRRLDPTQIEALNVNLNGDVDAVFSYFLSKQKLLTHPFLLL